MELIIILDEDFIDYPSAIRLRETVKLEMKFETIKNVNICNYFIFILVLMLVKN